MNREHRLGITTLIISILISMALFLWYQQSQTVLSMYNLFLFISVPSVIIISLLNPQVGFISLIFFIALSPTEWADGVPFFNYYYPFLKPGVNLFDGLLLAVTFIQFSRNRFSIKGNHALLLTFAAYTVFTIISVQISAYSNSTDSIYSLYIVLDLARMFLLMVNLTYFRVEHYKKFNVVLMIAAFILVLYMFSGQAVTSVDNRLSTLGIGPNGIGGFFPLLIPLSLSFVKSTSLSYRFGGIFCFILLWFGLLLSQSRSGIVGAAAGTVIMLLYLSRNKLRTAGILSASFIILLIASSKLPVLSRFSSGEADNGRFDLWIYSIKYVSEHIYLLLFGLGPGMYYEFALQYLGINIGYSPEHAHNYLITRLIENGLLAVSLEMALMIIPIYLLLRKFRKLPLWVHAYWIGLVSYHIHLIADYTLTIHKISVLYWLYVLSLWFIYRHLSNNKEWLSTNESSNDILLPRQS